MNASRFDRIFISCLTFSFSSVELIKPKKKTLKFSFSPNFATISDFLFLRSSEARTRRKTDRKNIVFSSSQSELEMNWIEQKRKMFWENQGQKKTRRKFPSIIDKSENILLIVIFSNADWPKDEPMTHVRSLFIHWIRICTLTHLIFLSLISSLKTVKILINVDGKRSPPVVVEREKFSQCWEYLRKL